MRDVEDLLRAAADSLPDNLALPHQVAARGRRRRARHRAVLACAAVVLVAVGGIVGVRVSGAAFGDRGQATIGAAPAAQEGDARNLVVDDTVRADLVAAWVHGQHLASSDVAGTRKGSVYYAFQPSTGRYYAVADFEPSASALSKHTELHGGAGDPLIQFQDGPWIFSRTSGGPWVLRSDTGGAGRWCPGVLPAAVIAVWYLPRSPSC